MPISRWHFLVMHLQVERAETKLSPVLKQMKGSLAEIPSGEKAKARSLVTLLSAHTTIKWSASLHVCEEEVDGHQNVLDVLFITESPPLSSMRSREDETYQSNQVHLSRLLLRHQCCAHCKGGVQPFWKCCGGNPLFCSLLHRRHQDYPLLHISHLL